MLLIFLHGSAGTTILVAQDKEPFFKILSVILSSIPLLCTVALMIGYSAYL